jgi:hypothetical protein
MNDNESLSRSAAIFGNDAIACWVGAIFCSIHVEMVPPRYFIIQHYIQDIELTDSNLNLKGVKITSTCDSLDASLYGLRFLKESVDSKLTAGSGYPILYCPHLLS